MLNLKLKPSLEEQYAMVEHQARKHLIDFSIATNPLYKPNWHHEIIAGELERIERGENDYKVLILMLPPRHGKSEEGSINFPAWYLGRNPDKEIITASYSADLAQDFGRKTRELVASEPFKRIFGITLKEDEKSVAKWRTDKNGSYTSVGVGGAITGRGADILDIDDPLKNREEADSQLIRDKQWEWFTSTAFTRLNPKGTIVLILTRWHLDDLAGRILQNNELKNSTKVIKFPAIAEQDEEYRKKGESLWPDRYPLADLLKIKATIGPYDWSALYQQNPVLSENQEFKPQWIKKRIWDEVQKLDTRRFLTVDTAISANDSNDSTGICMNWVDKENKWNLRAGRIRVNPKELIDILFQWQETFDFESIGIEKTVYLQAIKPFLDDEQRKRNKFLPIVELLHHQTQKEIRIRGLIPRYSSFSVYHIEGECDDLEEEQLMFPKGSRDDVLDASAYQLQIAQPPASYQNYEHIQRTRQVNRTTNSFE